MSLVNVRSLILFVVLFASCVHVALSQSAPKREFRGAWVATVTNIDWPLSRYDSPGKQQVDLQTQLDSLERMGVNAIIFQVRPSCDAFYQSTLEPWSEWLTGTQGLAPSSLWDPLAFAVAEAHKRGMELHAWINPYRAVVDTAVSSVSPQHISQTHPEWVMKFVKLKMLNPGLPEVREYVVSVIMDIVRRYDVDGVHFDDYFYPYSGITTEDDATWLAHNPNGLGKADWRRENVNRLVEMVRDSIVAVKPRVKFGISPFGIWRNQSTDPSGSLTSGLQSYDAIYCDTRHWLQQGWIDYAAPQVYWYFGFNVARYEVLVPWWNDNSYARHMYIGQATYRVSPSSGDWPVAEIANQIAYNRQHPNVQGNIHFSGKYFRLNTKQLNDSLKVTAYSKMTQETIPRPLALLPIMPWKDDVPPNTPDSMTITIFSSGGRYALVKWRHATTATDGDGPDRYVLYRSRTLPIDLDNIGNIIAVTRDSGWVVEKPFFGVEYYAVTALDRRHNESPHSNIVGLNDSSTVGTGDETRPAPFALLQNFPNPFNPATVIPFSLASEGHVSLRVYDLLGRELAVVLDEVRQAGYHQVAFDSQGLPTGTYFYRMISNGRVEVRSMHVVK